MRYSSRLTVAIHTLMCIENFDGEYKVTSDFIASSVNVNPVIIRKILGQLREAGIVSVDAGVGGAHITAKPKDVSMLDIFLAVENADSSLFHFHENPNPKCPVGSSVHAVLDEKLSEIQNAMEKQMASISLQSLFNEMTKQIAKK